MSLSWIALAGQHAGSPGMPYVGDTKRCTCRAVHDQVSEMEGYNPEGIQRALEDHINRSQLRQEDLSSKLQQFDIEEQRKYASGLRELVKSWQDTDQGHALHDIKKIIKRGFSYEVMVIWHLVCELYPGLAKILKADEDIVRRIYRCFKPPEQDKCKNILKACPYNGCCHVVTGGECELLLLAPTYLFSQGYTP